MKAIRDLRKYPALVGAVLLLGWAGQSSGWSGVVLVLSGVVMWLLLHVTHLMVILRRARRNPVGYVESAVMLNARLQERMTLLHVIGITRSLGAQESPLDGQPERFVWQDNGDNRVLTVFVGGKLESWKLERSNLILPDV